jgi:NitT/TauT family transport system ATP-binding protein
MVNNVENVQGQERPLIEIKNLSKIYRTLRHGDIHALDDISFSVADGEFVSIVGPSGCGKSTLLKILAALLPYTSGSVTINGHRLTGPSPEIGLVFQAPVLLPWRNILQNVLLPIEFHRLSPKDFRERAMSLIDLVGLKGFEDRYPHELSGGMQQRASIVRSLVHDPKMLLMDEPFGALDAMTREQMNLEVLKIWKASEKTILFVTHSITESIFLADTIVVMTARPGAIAEIIKVDLPRPRTLEMINSDKFGGYVSHIRELLHPKEGSQ